MSDVVVKPKFVVDLTGDEDVVAPLAASSSSAPGSKEQKTQDSKDFVGMWIILLKKPFKDLEFVNLDVAKIADMELSHSKKVMCISLSRLLSVDGQRAINDLAASDHSVTAKLLILNDVELMVESPELIGLLLFLSRRSFPYGFAWGMESMSRQETTSEIIKEIGEFVKAA